MKTLPVIIAFVLLAAVNVSAQQVKVGARGGLQLTTLSGDDIQEYRVMRPGVVAGFVAEVGGKLAFSTGLLMSTQGVRWSAFDEQLTVRMNYLRIPLEMKVNLGDPDKKVSGFFHVGPSLAVWVSARGILKFDGERETESYEFDSDFDRRIDVGVGAGGGISINLGKHIIQAGPSFCMGVLDINKYPDGRPDGVNPNLNVVIGVMNVTYLFMAKE